MSSFVKTRVRVALQPSRVNQPIVNIFGAQSPKIYKGAGVDFEIGLFDSDTAIYDPSNVTDMTVLVRNSAGTVLVNKTVAGPFVPITVEQWQAGTHQHGVVSLLGSETAIATGQHLLTIWGHTNDAGSDPDVFAYGSIEVIDAGITAITLPEVTPTYLTEQQISALLGNYLKLVGTAGAHRIEVSPNGLWRRVEGVDDYGQPTTRIEQVS